MEMLLGIQTNTRRPNSSRLNERVRVIIARLMSEKGISKSELASRMGVTRGAVTKLFEREEMSLSRLETILGALNVSIEVRCD